MKVSWPPIVFPIATAAVAATYVGVGTWDGWRAGLLPALAVIAAAVLVRLARGMPFSNPDQFDPHEVVGVTEALRSLARSLRGLIFVVLATMVALVIAAPLLKVLKRALQLQWGVVAERSLSGFVGLALAYAFVRTIQVVQSDISLIDRQARMLTNAVRRRHADAFEADVIKPATEMRRPPGYGEPLH